MPRPNVTLGEDVGPFQLGPWRVEPSLNRLYRGDREVRLEPKFMDVLKILTLRAGEVVSKDDLAASVWQGLYVTDSVITRAIAGLRKALEDDARDPRYIETISKRGYRLMMSPDVAMATIASPGPLPRVPAILPRRERSGVSPYIVGQWVRGADFCGRTQQIREILTGPRNGIWLVGLRAVGKTSLLRHIEFLTAGDRESPYCPLFWDLQGTSSVADLHEDFLETLLDAEDRLRGVGVDLAEVTQAQTFFGCLGALRRALWRQGKTLLLLWDEVEELIQLERESPSLLSKLRRALQSRDGIRTVMASSPRLWDLAEPQGDTSPFLHGFAPPVYLGPFETEVAQDIVGRLQTIGVDLELGEDVVGEIAECCGRHPSLLQLLCRRIAELGSVAAAVEAVWADPTVRYLFSVDLDLLGERDREILSILAANPGLTRTAPRLAALAREGTASPWSQLEGLGVIRWRSDQGAEVASPMLRRWLLKSEPPGEDLEAR